MMTALYVMLLVLLGCVVLLVATGTVAILYTALFAGRRKASTIMRPWPQPPPPQEPASASRPPKPTAPPLRDIKEGQTVRPRADRTH